MFAGARVTSLMHAGFFSWSMRHLAIRVGTSESACFLQIQIQDESTRVVQTSRGLDRYGDEFLGSGCVPNSQLNQLCRFLVHAPHAVPCTLYYFMIGLRSFVSRISSSNHPSLRLSDEFLRRRHSKYRDYKDPTLQYDLGDILLGRVCTFRRSDLWMVLLQ